MKILRHLNLWTIAYVKKGNDHVSSYKKGAIQNDIKVLFKNKWYNYADPFIYKFNGHNYLFFEYQSLFSFKGKIGYVDLDSNSNSNSNSRIKIVLNKKYHLSYPFIYKDNNGIYMIPETQSAKSIDLYEAVSFPDKWEFKKSLISGISVVDSTILQHNNKQRYKQISR